MIKRFFNAMPPRVQGLVEYYLRPSSRQGFGGPFNGQKHRQVMFRETIRALNASAIVETGAFRGTTTEFMATESNLPVWTVEFSPRFHVYSQRRLARLPKVRLRRGDSRSFLRELGIDPTVPRQNVFFYLDAHWEDDLPLRDEVQIIRKHFSRFAIMVDDFKVDDDPDYAYDDYGNGKCLELAYLGALDALGLQAYFPSLPGAHETGGKRGSVMLFDEPAACVASQIPSLRPARGF